MSHREALVAAAEALIWANGYEATSPRAILKASGAGQGSMYHHFSGKEGLAVVALENHERALMAWTETHLAGEGLSAIEGWLTAPRDALGGCRLGRLANEQTVRNTPALRAPMTRYFEGLHALLAARIQEAIAADELSPETDPAALASALTAVVQGGYVLALATQTPEHLEGATRAALALLKGSAP